MHEFDVLLRLGPDQLDYAVDGSVACSAARRAVSEFPGVRSVEVERSAEPPVSGSEWVVLSMLRGGEAPATEAWNRLRARIGRVALVAIDGSQIDGRAAEAGTDASSSEVRTDVRGFADAQGFRLDGQPPSDTGQTSPAVTPSPGDGAKDPPPDHVVLARLLSLVNPHVDPEQLARGAIRRFGSFAAVLSAPVRDLRAMPGFGMHSIAAIKLVHEAAMRLARAGVMHRPVLDNWPRLIDYLAAQLGREKIEQFRVLFLDGRDRLLADEAQARGTVNHTPVYPREVVRRALELQAASVILVHNHPSGDPTPSREDLVMTAQVGEAAAVLSIVLQDHVIVGNGRWVSFRQEGLL